MARSSHQSSFNREDECFAATLPKLDQSLSLSLKSRMTAVIRFSVLASGGRFEPWKVERVGGQLSGIFIAFEIRCWTKASRHTIRSYMRPAAPQSERNCEDFLAWYSMLTKETSTLLPLYRGKDWRNSGTHHWR